MIGWRIDSECHALTNGAHALGIYDGPNYVKGKCGKLYSSQGGKTELLDGSYEVSDGWDAMTFTVEIKLGYWIDSPYRKTYL